MNDEEIAREFIKKDLKLSKCMGKLQLLLFKISITPNDEKTAVNMQKFIKKEKKCLKLVNELKDFCTFHKIPVDIDKIYLLKETKED